MDYQILHEALSRKRAHESETDAEFAGVLMRHLASFGLLPDRIDAAGNMYYSVGASRSLFVAHIDTAHHRSGTNSYTLHRTETTQYKKTSVGLMAKSMWAQADGDCLGADDGAGVMLLCWMMQNGVPGAYLFTRGEEVGGIGATYIADNYADWLSGFDRAVCFDRRGYQDVITHQGGQRCASDVFGEALASALCDNDMLYMPSSEGVYTDCKEFIEYIPECVNISTGYFKEHGPQESLNLDHLRHLAKAVLAIDWESLPVERDPADADSVFTNYRYAYKRDRSVSKETYRRIVSKAIDDGDTWKLEDMICDSLDLSMKEYGTFCCDFLSASDLTEALNMEPTAGIKFLYELAQRVH